MWNVGLRFTDTEEVLLLCCDVSIPASFLAGRFAPARTISQNLIGRRAGDRLRARRMAGAVELELDWREGTWAGIFGSGYFGEDRDRYFGVLLGDLVGDGVAKVRATESLCWG